MTITVYFIRHAQAMSNVAADVYPKGSLERLQVYQSEQYFNAPLSPAGELQAKTQLTKRFEDVAEVDVVYVSTLLRTLQTAHHGLAKFHAAGSKTRWIASDVMREFSYSCQKDGKHHPCNYRGPDSILQAESAFPYLNYDGVQREDPIPKGESMESVKGRVMEMLRLLQRYRTENTDGCDKNVVVVTHSGFLSMFYTCVFKNERWFENCEVAAESLDDVLSKAEQNGFNF